MSRRKTEVQKMIDEHLGLHGSPSLQEMDDARERAFQHLRSKASVTTPSIASNPPRIHAGWRLGLVAVLAAAIVVAVFLGMPGSPAVLEGVAGSRKIAFGEVVRSGGVPAGTLVLADSSRLEIGTNSELLLERADDGVRTHLSKGSVLVTAAKQRNGHLYVQTKDLIVTVVGTVFRVEVEQEGSGVAVIEGEVRVKYGEIEKILRKGEQVATNPNMERIQQTALQPSTTTPPQRSTTAPARPNIVGDYWVVVPPRDPDAAGDPPAPLQPQPVSNVPPGEVPKWEAVSIRPCPPSSAPGEGGPRGGAGGGGGGGGGPYRFSSDRMTLNCLTVRSLIRSAYHVYNDPPRAIPGHAVLQRGWFGGRGKDPIDGTEGGPDWIDTELYTIEAKAEVVTDQALMQGPMLQAILEERFKIKVHKEAREVPVDALVLAKGGSKLKPFVEGSCVRRPPPRYLGGPPNPPDPPDPGKLHIEADANGKLSGTIESKGDIRPLADIRVEGQSLSFTASGFFGGGHLKGSIEDNGARLSFVYPPLPDRDPEGRPIEPGPVPPPLVFTRARPTIQRYCRVEGGRIALNRPANRFYDVEGVTIDEFAKLFLNERRGRYVINKTGLDGKFDIHLEEEISAETRQREDPNGDRFAPSTAPPFPEALEKQLGLKLESTKGPVELLIIDYIERPSEN
jgi:hypothetical protein